MFGELFLFAKEVRLLLAGWRLRLVLNLYATDDLIDPIDSERSSVEAYK